MRVCVLVISKGETDNDSLPLSDISNRQPTTTSSLSSSDGYLAPIEPSEVNTERPATYQELPSPTESHQEYSYVVSVPNITAPTPRQQPNIDTQSPRRYQQLLPPSQTAHEDVYYNVHGPANLNKTGPSEESNTDTQTPVDYVNRATYNDIRYFHN